jgi:hypothetical protein
MNSDKDEANETASDDNGETVEPKHPSEEAESLEPINCIRYSVIRKNHYNTMDEEDKTDDEE